MKKNLTARFVDTVKPPNRGRAEYWDTVLKSRRASFGLRVTEKGVKSWVIFYRAGRGRGAPQRRLTFNHYPTMDLADARAKAQELISDIAKGGDPARAKQEAKANLTVEEAYKIFLEEYVKIANTTDTYNGTKSIFEGDVLPRIGKMQMQSITEKDIEKVFPPIIARGSPIQANRVFGRLMKFFNWAAGKKSKGHKPARPVKKYKFIPSNPMEDLERPTPQEPPRERDLKSFEIRSIWRSVDGSKSAYHDGIIAMREGTKIALELLMLLGQRVGEVSQAPKAEFDLEEESWTISRERLKNRASERARDHVVPLPAKALGLVKRAFELSGDSTYLFPSPFSTKGRKEDRPISATSLNKALGRVLEKTKIEDVRPHDFREVVVSGLYALDIKERHVQAVINHLPKNVIEKHYNRYKFFTEKKAALEAWEQKLMATVNKKEENDPS
ncbi:MAG: integrase arm-type DNA-binding domain-containing protein [Sphingomonadales bacterium]